MSQFDDKAPSRDYVVATSKLAQIKSVIDRTQFTYAFDGDGFNGAECYLKTEVDELLDIINQILEKGRYDKKKT